MEKNELIVTEFDIVTTKGSTQIIKALIPYLSPREQKMIGIIIRIWELIQTLRFFEKQEFSSHKNTDILDLNPELVRHIKKYCTPETQHMLDMILQFMNMSELMNIMNMFENDPTDNTPGSENPLGSIMNIFKTMNQAGMDISGMNNSGANDSGMKKGPDTPPPSGFSGNPPVSILQSMMSENQGNLYREFMDKLNQDFNDEAEQNDSKF